MPDLHPLTAPDDEPAAPTPWISLADLILATLATGVLIGMVVLCLYHIRMKALEQKLLEFSEMKLVSAEDKDWLDINRHREFLPEDMLPISEEDHKEWLQKKGKEVLHPDFVAVEKEDWMAAQDALKTQTGTPNKPIVLGLDEVKGFRFEKGSADLQPDFKTNLEGDVLAKIEEVVRNYGIEVLEIVGHTDGTPLGVPHGNLDHTLNELELGRIDHGFVSSLKGGSNADLGLMRALSVASYLHDLTSRSDDVRIRALVFRTYSAAQLIDPNLDIIHGAPNQDKEERRRIELRFTRKSISLRE